jgi:hypothetical protein
MMDREEADSIGIWDDLRVIVDYMLVDERRHYEETARPDRAGHIYLYLRRVDNWLRSRTNPIKAQSLKARGRGD